MEPRTESLQATERRFLPYWQTAILPRLTEVAKILVVAHGNFLRALVKNLDLIDDREVEDLNIPLGIPIVHKFSGISHKKSTFEVG